MSKHRFKAGDWVRVRKEIDIDEYPTHQAHEADDITRVAEEFPGITEVLLVIRSRHQGQDNIVYYDCTIHPVFPWHKVFEVLGGGPGVDGPGNVVLYEWELEPYDGNALLDRPNEERTT